LLHHAGLDRFQGRKWRVNNVGTKANKFLWPLDHPFTRRLARNLGTIVHQKNATISVDILPSKRAKTVDFIEFCRSPGHGAAINIGAFRDRVFKQSNFGPNSHRFVTAKVPRKRAVNKTEKNSFFLCKLPLKKSGEQCNNHYSLWSAPSSIACGFPTFIPALWITIVSRSK
jgi:hypothetical protein